MAWRNHEMAKDRDFFDYLSLGNQLIQTSRLGEVRSSEATRVRLEAERLEVEKLNARAQAHEEKIRDFVFDSSKWLHGLKADFAHRKPLGTLALLYGLQRHIETLGISTARVRSYEDKEKVHEFLEEVKKAVAECEHRLDAKGIQDAATYAKYRAEESSLAALIDCEEKRLELKEREQELAKLGTPGMVHNLPPFLAALMFGVGCSLLMCAVALSEAKQTVDSAHPGWGFALLLLGGWGLKYKRKNEALLLKEKLDEEFEEFELEADVVAHLRKQVGDRDIAGYRKLQAERAAFVEQILRDDESVQRLDDRTT